jgi:hypothetical protein
MSPKLRGVLRWSAIGVTLVGLTVVLGAVTALVASREGVPLDRALLGLFIAFATAVMIVAFGVGVVWMRAIDEAAREAHKAAWYWGGSAGMAVGGVLLILAVLPQSAAVELPLWLDGRNDPVAHAATGAFALMLLMVTGYTLAWAWWWLKRR